MFGYLKVFATTGESRLVVVLLLLRQGGEHYPDTNNIKLVTYTYGELGNKLVRAAEWG